jgi:hypothetical protein
MDEKKLTGGKTDEEIQLLKKKHGSITLMTIEPDKHYWFKKPDMATLSAVTKISQADPLAAAQVFFKNCLVEGDQTTVDNVDEFASLAPYIGDLIETKSVEVKNF